jgi:xanthine/CO dehydrogenase XdhC/CoxF family maturation factor
VLEFIDQCARLHEAGAIATVYEVTGEPGARIGGRVMMREGSATLGTISDPELAGQMRAACAETLLSGRPRHIRCANREGSAEVFVELLPPATPLVVFGAGPDAVPLVRIAKSLGWQVTLVDGRQAFLTRQAFPDADHLLLARPEDTAQSVRIPRGAASVVLTHNFEHDTAIVKALLASPPLHRRPPRPGRRRCPRPAAR